MWDRSNFISSIRHISKRFVYNKKFNKYFIKETKLKFFFKITDNEIEKQFAWINNSENLKDDDIGSLKIAEQIMELYKQICECAIETTLPYKKEEYIPQLAPVVRLVNIFNILKILKLIFHTLITFIANIIKNKKTYSIFSKTRPWW